MRRRRRRVRVLPALALACVLALAVWLILVTQVFIVREVRVEGAGDDAQQVARMSGIQLGSRMGAADASQVRINVESNGRYAFVEMDERYPNSVILTVRPRTRDAIVSQGGKVLVLDSDAYVISVEDGLPAQSLPYVTGLRPSNYIVGRQLDTADGRCGAMKAVLEAVRQHNAWNYVSEISVADLSRLTITSRTGILVTLGDASNMNNKILWMVGTLADLESRGEVTGTLDVSSGTKADYKASAPSWATAAEDGPILSDVS